MPERAIERAEPAARRANVGVVYVAVDDVRHHAFRMLSPPDGVGGKAEIEERGRRREPFALCRANAFAFGRPREEPVERGGRSGRRPIVVEKANACFRQQPSTCGLFVETLEPATLLVPQVVANGI